MSASPTQSDPRQQRRERAFRGPAGDTGARRGFPTRYSRFVGTMKISLPLIAGGLVLAVLAWPGAFHQGDGFRLRFADVGIGKDATLAMVRPRYIGTDSEDRPYTITADVAEQDPKDPRTVRLRALQADLTLANGNWLSVMARHGIYDQAGRALRLSGDVTLFSDSGYEFHAPAIAIDLNAGSAASDQPVRGQGPLGELRARRMAVTDRGRSLRFEGGVTLIVYPAGGAG